MREVKKKVSENGIVTTSGTFQCPESFKKIDDLTRKIESTNNHGEEVTLKMQLVRTGIDKKNKRTRGKEGGSFLNRGEGRMEIAYRQKIKGGSGRAKDHSHRGVERRKWTYWKSAAMKGRPYVLLQKGTFRLKNYEERTTRNTAVGGESKKKGLMEI